MEIKTNEKVHLWKSMSDDQSRFYSLFMVKIKIIHDSFSLIFYVSFFSSSFFPIQIHLPTLQTGMDWDRYLPHSEELDKLYDEFARSACDNYDLYKLPVEDSTQESVGSLFDQEINASSNEDQEESKLLYEETDPL